MPVLILEHGKDRAGVVLNGPMVIGRASGLDLVVKADGMSRIHAIIDNEDDRYFIRDLDSRNGVRVNQQRIEDRVFLRPGNVLRLGMATFSYRDTEQLPEGVKAIDLHSRKNVGSVIFRCGECRSVLKAEPGRAGEAGRCLSCHARLLIPEKTGVVAQVAPKDEVVAKAVSTAPEPVTNTAPTERPESPVSVPAPAEEPEQIVLDFDDADGKLVEESAANDSDVDWMPEAVELSATQDDEAAGDPVQMSNLDADEPFVDLYDIDTDDISDERDDEAVEEPRSMFSSTANETVTNDAEVEPAAAKTEPDVTDPVVDVTESNDEFDATLAGELVLDEEEPEEDTLSAVPLAGSEEEVAEQAAEAFGSFNADEPIEFDDDAETVSDTVSMAEAEIETEAEPATESMIEWLDEAGSDAHAVVTDSSTVWESIALGLCTVCQSMVMESEAHQHCESCGTHYHEECWQENFGCASYGCSEVDVLRPADESIDDVEAGLIDAPAEKQSAKPEKRRDDSVPWEKVALSGSFFAMVCSLFTMGVPSGLVLLGTLGYLVRKRQRKVSKLAVTAVLLVCSAGIGVGVIATQMLVKLQWLGI